MRITAISNHNFGYAMYITAYIVLENIRVELHSPDSIGHSVCITAVPNHSFEYAMCITVPNHSFGYALCITKVLCEGPWFSEG